jgi:hypothetical protein
MAKDFNLADDMKIRLEQALEALSEARDAIDSASDGLKDALHNVRLVATTGTQSTRGTRSPAAGSALGTRSDCLAALSRYLDGNSNNQRSRPHHRRPHHRRPHHRRPHHRRPHHRRPHHRRPHKTLRYWRGLRGWRRRH